MRKCPILVSVVALLAVTGDIKADDREDIVSVHEALFAAWNANDIDVVQGFYAPNFTAYNPNGNLLTSFDWERVKKWHETGSINVGEPQHLEIHISGSIAILTYYVRLTVNFSDGETETQTRRSTTIMTKASGQWKYLHYHGSFLTPTNPE
jgi:ketosteroid isomerase-like protein|tara:strand:- start:421 stop:873 length:453 start_codon:yes stop_codon:yes gene_type:complete